MPTLHKQLVFTVAVLLLMSIVVVLAGVPPLSRYEAIMKQATPISQGLYNSTDKVKILTGSNFNKEVVNSNHSTLVEFYNSFCGHCKRFAPSYKNLAEYLFSWHEIMPVCAVDCALGVNYALCREYEIMGYPTLRYFGLNFTPQADNYGIPINLYDFEIINILLAQFIANEKPPNDSKSSWPDFQPLSEDNLLAQLNTLKPNVKYAILIYEPENSTLGIEITLHLSRYPDVIVRRTSDANLAHKYKIDGEIYKMATINRLGDIVPYSPSDNSTNAFLETIKSFLEAEHLTEKPFKQQVPTVLQTNELEDIEKSELLQILKEVKRNKHMVYQADLEMAIHNILLNEIPKTFNISGDRLSALRQFITILDKYNPLGPNGQLFISNLLQFVQHDADEITGEAFDVAVKRLHHQHMPVFRAKRYVGCTGSQANMRGYTCSLWQLCHFMTVQASKMPNNSNALDVLQAIHGYVKYFFGCTDCSQHFQEMAKNRQMWNVTDHDEAILWLWAAHNEVNARLAGDITEDPQFPKVQFPTADSCPKCHNDLKSSTIPSLSTTSPASLSLVFSSLDKWNLKHVLQFLKNIHNINFINHYDLLTIDQQSAHNGIDSMQRTRQKRMITNVFTDIDIRMGMLLYGCCIIMIVSAFKLFALKGGYRRKPYGSHPFTKV